MTFLFNVRGSRPLPRADAWTPCMPDVAFMLRGCSAYVLDMPSLTLGKWPICLAGDYAKRFLATFGKRVL
jgi:hypothetical protein